MKYTQCVEINDQYLTVMWTLDVVPKIRNQRRKKRSAFMYKKKKIEPDCCTVLDLQIPNSQYI